MNQTDEQYEEIAKRDFENKIYADCAYEDKLLNIKMRRAEHWEGACDDCQSQEGRHYCLLHAMTVKNMDIMRCEDFLSRR